LNVKIVFFGTPSFAAKILQFLIDEKIEIAAVVTQPDRPQGRNLILTPPMVKETALRTALQIPISQPEKASDPQFLDALASLHADLFVVVAFGQILSRKLLAIPPLGCINVHASLLPKYRGAAPMQRALLNGDKETGVSIQKMVYELDAGDVIDETKIIISPDTTLGELQERLCECSKILLLNVLKKYQNGIPPARPQDPKQATLAPKIKPEEMEIRWDRDAEHLHNLVRALSPRPGAWCWVEIKGEKKRLKILRTHLAPQSGSPGELLRFQGNDCLIAASKHSLQLLEVQIEGKKAMPAADWMRGFTAPPRFSIN
jgi:methionyl-tRNA formyltransferase